ncbi:MAG: metal-dependent hydrolase [Alphaproteobacteria bacterium]|nr:metal-dependent hydrolase [Alphaproteobacteria bacterium]
MANYATHIAVGTVVSGALATLTVGADILAPESIMAVTLAGVAGSVLPDVDLRDSRASAILFSGIGVFASFCVLFLNADKYSLVELWILWLGSLVLVRYGLSSFFYYISVHRGVWHSLLAGLFWAGLTAILFHYVLRLHEGVAWLGGGFMFIGYLTHLILDEIYSVDFMGNRLKASFGTALKVYDSRYPAKSAALAIVTAALLFAGPTPAPFIEAISSPSLWSGLNQRLLPSDNRWFGLTVPRQAVAEPTTVTSSPITTGSLPDRSGSHDGSGSDGTRHDGARHDGAREGETSLPHQELVPPEPAAAGGAAAR